MNKKELLINEIISWIRHAQNDRNLISCLGKGNKGIIKQKKFIKDFKDNLDNGDSILTNILDKLSFKDLNSLIFTLNLKEKKQ